jgi:hypothetical protein
MGYDSGRLAVYAAEVAYTPEKIYLLGFDMGGTNLYHDEEFKAPKNYHLAWTGLAELCGADLIIVSDEPHRYQKELKDHYEFITYQELLDD